jgi:hypothetical protein
MMGKVERSADRFPAVVEVPVAAILQNSMKILAASRIKFS